MSAYRGVDAEFAERALSPRGELRRELAYVRRRLAYDTLTGHERKHLEAEFVALEGALGIKRAAGRRAKRSGLERAVTRSPARAVLPS